MSPRDRLLRTLRGEKADRVPLVLEGFTCADREQVEAIADPARREIAERIFGRTAAAIACDSYVNRHLVTPRSS